MMESSKRSSLFLLLGFLLLLPRPSLALALSASASTSEETAAASPATCKLEAEVLGATSSPAVDRYALQLSVSSLSAASGTAADACPQSLGQQIGQAGATISAADYQSAGLKPGDRIQATVAAGGSTDSMMQDIRVIQRTAAPAVQEGPDASDYDDAPLLIFTVAACLGLAALTYRSTRKER